MAFLCYKCKDKSIQSKLFVAGRNILSLPPNGKQYICGMSEEASPKTLINLRVDRELAEAGKALAKKRGANLSTLLRMLLIRELEADKLLVK
ncbi:BrnA antitoxin family protein (plasmid) [Hymenobacter monticola]|uniref:BrnA antitoxin family protein n=2 Tax=Hymenobacter monticola TaxID=1705399 RepID=A0ABY4BC93_9BACT|nr:BrnA antitoxin family protein [Hymenobacter monticola]UOE36773.1 BrnA antitoxin family protein [Hymenobacter monticola]